MKKSEYSGLYGDYSLDVDLDALNAEAIAAEEEAMAESEQAK